MHKDAHAVELAAFGPSDEETEVYWVERLSLRELPDDEQHRRAMKWLRRRRLASGGGHVRVAEDRPAAKCQDIVARLIAALGYRPEDALPKAGQRTNLVKTATLVLAARTWGLCAREVAAGMHVPERRVWDATRRGTGDEEAATRAAEAIGRE